MSQKVTLIYTQYNYVYFLCYYLAKHLRLLNHHIKDLLKEKLQVPVYG